LFSCTAEAVESCSQNGQVISTGQHFHKLEKKERQEALRGFEVGDERN